MKYFARRLKVTDAHAWYGMVYENTLDIPGRTELVKRLNSLYLVNIAKINHRQNEFCDFESLNFRIAHWIQMRLIEKTLWKSSVSTLRRSSILKH